MPKRISDLPTAKYVYVTDSPPRANAPASLSELPVIMNSTEAAHVLGITQPTMKKLLYSGEIVGFKVGVNWRIRKEKLLEYIEAGETEVKEARKA